jgi:hypothetical protein
MAKVERGHGFVQEQEAGFAAYGACEHDQLALAARKGGDRPVPEMEQANSFERGGRERVIARRIDDQARAVGVAPKEDHLLDGEGKVDPGVLGNVADDARPLAAGDTVDRPTFEEHVAATRAQQPGEQPDQGRLPGAIRPDEADEFTGQHLEVNAFDD